MGLKDFFNLANPITSATEIIGTIGDAAGSIREAITGKLSPDDQAKFDLAWQGLTQQLQLGQQAINLAEANSGSNFRGGWRPAIGWVCALALGAYYIPQALIGAILWFAQCGWAMWAAADITRLVLPAYPVTFDVGEIIGLVVSLLGLAGLRTYDLKSGSRK